MIVSLVEAKKPLLFTNACVGHKNTEILPRKAGFNSKRYGYDRSN